ncbi:PREDICTED: heat stress transcription factor A-4a-like isoform X1 [Camelina sativa]|uniref:Heat stress transcription factor A-4a-like isoform X1 n=2 Tax=Camelina sativa TaxID=90675 RepID=A0ABM1QRR3_CAMSA|nr:PREDICTED: heat stress transcription factor A-4a-like isoform X1 [Camelina sativa]
MDGDNNNHGAPHPVSIEQKKMCLDFMRKAYAMVDDPSTDLIISWGFNRDSFIVWHPPECYRDLLPRLLGVPDFYRFRLYGFKKVVSSVHLEYARDDFVKGRPELLEKIGQSFLEEREKKMKPLRDAMRNCKNMDEERLVTKEWMATLERERRVQVDKDFLKDADLLLLRISKYKERRAKSFTRFGGYYYY